MEREKIIRASINNSLVAHKARQSWNNKPMYINILSWIAEVTSAFEPVISTFAKFTNKRELVKRNIQLRRIWNYALRLTDLTYTHKRAQRAYIMFLGNWGFSDVKLEGGKKVTGWSSSSVDFSHVCFMNKNLQRLEMDILALVECLKNDGPTVQWWELM